MSETHDSSDCPSCCGQSPEERSCSENDPRDVPLPDPMITDLVRGLATQAMLSMGMFPHPGTGQTAIMPYQAKHLIDSALHELRMIYVAAQNEKKRREGTVAENERATEQA